MNLQLLTNLILSTPRGHFVTVAWERPGKTRAAYKSMNIRKRVEGRVRLGIDYDNVKDVKECRESGELPAVPNNGRPTWFFYPEGLFPYIAEHKTNGTRYVALYFAKDGEGDKVGNLRSTWLLDGKPVSESDVAPFLLADELKGEALRKADNTFHLALANLTRFTAEGKAINWIAPNYAPVPDRE